MSIYGTDRIKETVLDANGYLVEVQMIPNREWKDRSRKPRIYVGGLEDHDPIAKSLLDASIACDDKAEWQPINRVLHARVRPVADAAIAAAGYHARKLTWSDKAGCGCGCSPGFIAQEGFTGYDIHISVKGLAIKLEVAA